MKKLFVIILVGLILSACSEPKKNQPKYEKAVSNIPQAKLVGKTRYGYVYSLNDGTNTIYIYERGGGGSITVVK